MNATTRKVTVRTVARPYTLTFRATDPGETYSSSYPLSSEEAQRLLDEYPVVRALPNFVSLRPDQPGLISELRPATLGGGAAFEITRG